MNEARLLLKSRFFYNRGRRSGKGRGCVPMNNFLFENKTKVYFGKGGVKEYLG